MFEPHGNVTHFDEMCLGALEDSAEKRQNMTGVTDRRRKLTYKVY